MKFEVFVFFIYPEVSAPTKPSCTPSRDDCDIVCAEVWTPVCFKNFPSHTFSAHISNQILKLAGVFPVCEFERSARDRSQINSNLSVYVKKISIVGLNLKKLEVIRSESWSYLVRILKLPKVKTVKFKWI